MIYTFMYNCIIKTEYHYCRYYYNVISSTYYAPFNLSKLRVRWRCRRCITFPLPTSLRRVCRAGWWQTCAELQQRYVCVCVLSDSAFYRCLSASQRKMCGSSCLYSTICTALQGHLWYKVIFFICFFFSFNTSTHVSYRSYILIFSSFSVFYFA